MENINNISPGLIESYVLGTCTEEESLQITELCKNNPEILAEVEAIEKAIIEHASAIAPDNSPDLKKALFRKLKFVVIVNFALSSPVYMLQSLAS